MTIEGKKTALMMLHSPESWLKSGEINGHGVQQRVALTAEEHKEEMLLMGLRLPEGIPRTRFKAQLGQQPEQLFPEKKLVMLAEEGLIGLDNAHLYATRKGMKLLNMIVKELLV
jgi:oxygen-independent coproporphyrinogen-3 oxidase